MNNFITPINNYPALNEISSSPDLFSLPWEEIHGSLTSYKDWMDEDTSKGGEFLDDVLRIKDQPWGLHN